MIEIRAVTRWRDAADARSVGTRADAGLLSTLDSEQTGAAKVYT